MYDLRFGSSAPTARDEGIGAADSPTGEAISAEAMEDAPTSEEERLDGLLADVEEMERAQEIAAAGLSGRNADEIEAKERYVGTEAAKAVEKVVTSLRGKVKDAVTRAELEERVPEEDRKGLISQEDELIMPANEGVIDAVKAATGRDVTGYYHAVSEEKIWHAVSKHSHDSTSKVYSNQLDLTWDDFALLPDILDTGKPGVEKWKGDTVISYTKEYGNICFKVLQRIGRKRRHGTSRLMFVTEWIEKTAGRKGLAPVKARDQVPSSPGEVIQARGVEDVKGKNLVNGMYAEAGDGSVYGVARVEDLSISADVPQFKKKEVAGQREAANEDGTTHELSGGWNAKSAPIIVWRRRDGRLEVISGRHRLAHAKKNGVGHIAVRVYDEDAAHDAAWAKLYDVEVNILEGMCNAIDVAFYFRHNPMSLAEAEARGLMPKTQAGGQTAASRMGIMIATRASGYVFDSLVNGGVSAEDAYMACVITESAEGQELALKARRGTKGKKRSWEYVTALVRGAEQMAPEGGSGLMDLFGFDEGFAKRAEKMANYVEAVRRQLRRRIEVLSGAGSLQRKGEMTREMGVKIDRPEDAVRIIERLAKLDAAYEAMDPELGIAAAAEAWDGKSEVQIDWRQGQLSGNSEQVGDGSFSVSARFLGTAQEAKDALRSVQGRVFRNEATGIEAMVTSDTLSKSYAAQMSVRNLMALGYSQEEARQIHYSAFAHVHEIFERADYGEFEKNYAPEQKKGRAGAWHYYGTVDIEGKGSFDVNVTAVVPDRNGGDNRLFSLELTIENPADGRLGYPHTTGPSFNAAGSSEHRLAAYRSNVEKEILKIREEAMKDGTYMKAPNGERSRLDERTWCVVRTRAFKDYFGDWENEPEGASKVVDSNGEPMLVYHGTPEDFGNVFEDKQPEYRDYDPNYHRGTFWFTDRMFTAQTYQARAVFTKYPEEFRRLDTEWEHEDVPAGEHADVLEGLKERTVFRAYDKRGRLHGVRVKLSEAFDEDGMLKDGYYVSLAWKKGEEYNKLPSGKAATPELLHLTRHQNFFLNEGVKPPKTHNEALEFYARFEGVGDKISVPKRSRLYACFLNIRNPKVYDYKGAQFRNMGYRAGEAQAQGHDGVIVKNVYDPGNYPDAVLPGMSIGVFSPGQIKSVDNRGTFDAGSGDISFSVAEAREMGMFKDGVMEAGNGVIVDGGADFSASVDFMHVSPALYRKPDREHVGEGFGAQMFGWGVLYGVTNPKENRKIFDDATIKETLFVRKRDGREESVAGKEVLEELARRGVTDEDILRSLQNYSWMGSKSYYENERKGRIKDLNTEKEILERAKRANDAQRQKIAETNIAYYEQEVAALDYLIENDIYVREGGAKRYPVNYRMRADVDDGNVLHWDEDADKFINEHPDVAEAMNVAEAGEMEDAFGDAIKMRWGKNIYFFLAKKLGSARAASEWLDAHGIRGVKYRDDATYGQENGTYNYVIFNPDYIEVIAINNRHEWSEYSEDNPDWQRPEDVFNEDGGMSASVAMWKGTLGALRGNFPARGTADYVKDILVCPTPAVMRMVGVRPWDLVITPAVIEKVTKISHGVPYAALEQLPEALAEPICIAVSDTAKSIEVITELKEGNDNILVAVRLDSNLMNAPQVKVNRIVSLYGKEWIANLLKHPMLYFDKMKALPWIASRRLQLPPIINLKSASSGRIMTRKDLVKYKVESGQSFSVRGEGLLDRVNLREMAQEEKMSRLMTRARRGAARWRRVFMDDKTSAADAARALGEVSSVMEAVYAYLPAGERPSYAGKMRLVEAYARLVETGRVWHQENAKSEGARAKQEVLDEAMAELERVSTVKGEALRELREGYVREVAGRKLSEVAVSMVEDAVDAVERHLVRREMEKVKRLAEALRPKKLKSGKLAPGKMSAEAYRRFERYMGMVEMSAEKKAERMEELAAKLDKESEAEKQEPIEEEMRELATFGALGSGKLADVRRGVRELVGFVRAERTSWEGRVELEKEQMKHFARVAVEAMGGVDRNKLAAKRDRAKKPLRTILGTQKGFMSLGQMWMAMQGVPALRGLAEWSLERLARGNVALGMRERALREAEVAFMAQELGLTSEAARNNFLVDLKKERATGVRKAGEKRVHKVRVSVEEAREIVAMNF